MGRLDFVVHGAAFAPREALSAPFSQTTREAFRMALDISAYSLVALARGAQPLMTEGGSLLTLTYLGAERVLPNYNVMGVAKAALECSVRYLASDLGPQNIRVNAISAGPVKTLAAAGISGFSDILGVYRDRAPLRRNTEAERSRRHRPVPDQRRRARHHRRGPLRGRRLPRDGDVGDRLGGAARRGAVTRRRRSRALQREHRHFGPHVEPHHQRVPDAAADVEPPAARRPSISPLV